MRRNHLTDFLLIGLFLLGNTLNGLGQSSSIPNWLATNWAQRTQNEGIWITDNSAYQSEQETFDAYGMQWTYGLGKKHLKGRLFGVINGMEQGDFWEFFEYWDPASKEVRIIQIGGNGTIGIGKMWQQANGRIKEQQVFTQPDGSAFEAGHEAWMEQGNQYIQSFNILEGTWTKRRFYIWKQKTKESEIQTPNVYSKLAHLIGVWQIDLGEDRKARMKFEWAENKRMIKYYSTFQFSPGVPYKTESEGIITYHGVKDKVVFMNTYMGEDDNLISEGVYEVDKNGVIHRKFTCFYKEGEGLPWSNGVKAPKGGKSIEFKQIWTPIDTDSFTGDFFWKKNGKWVHPIKEYDEEGFQEIWKRLKE